MISPPSSTANRLPRLGRLRAGRLAREPEPWLLAALAVWSLIPFGLLIGHHGVFNGSDGIQVADHLQHMAFIRDAGEHGLISSRFDLAPDPHLFLHPVFLLSGGLWRLGLSIQLAFLIWLPVAVGALFFGFAAYVRRTLGEDRRARLAALALALFFVTPATPLADWLGAGPRLKFGTLVMGFEMFPAGFPWGGFAGGIAVALMPVFLLGVERVLDPARRKAGRSRRWYIGWTALAGMFASWLHPWQGMILVLVLGGLWAWSRFARRYLVLALPAALTVAPLVYYWALGHTDSAWAFVSRTNDYQHFGTWLVLSLIPLAVALPAYFRGPGEDVQERALRLWPAAAALLYFALHKSWFFHSFAGISLPLGILAVRSVRQLRVPRVVAVASLVAVTLPGMVFAIERLFQARSDHFLADGEAQALRFLDRSPRPGGVLAPLEVGQAVPAFSGRSSWVAHYYWTPDYGVRRATAASLFSGRMTPSQARATVRQVGAPWLMSSCRRNADLTRALRGLLLSTHRFGCATVYELRTPL
jgi:hypothetical protein